MAHHDSVLSQLLKLVPRLEFEKQANRCDGRRRSDALSRWSQFVALTMGQLGGRRSLRDIEATARSQGHHRYHLGNQSISRSALGRANERLDYRFYEGLFQSLYQLCLSNQRRHGFRFKSKRFSLDASLIDVSMKVFPWASFGRKKSAFKLHLGLDHDGLIPAFACVTQGKVSDMVYARQLALPKGSVVVFDKGYNCYRWHNSLTENGIFYVFISNQFNWSAKTIADIYKQRWQVELFFKWIKQNLKIKAFLGNTENAVMT